MKIAHRLPSTSNRDNAKNKMPVPQIYHMVHIPLLDQICILKTVSMMISTLMQKLPNVLIF